MQRVNFNAPLPPPRRVQWADQWTGPDAHKNWKPNRVLDTHEVARRAAKIKAQPARKAAPVAKAIKKPKPALKLEKPRWTPMQRFLRGEMLGELAVAALFTTIFCLAFVGPIAGVIPAALAVYCCVAVAYRTFGPDPQNVAREQAIKRAIAANLANDARVLRAAGAIKDAKVAERMVKRWK